MRALFRKSCWAVTLLIALVWNVACGGAAGGVPRPTVAEADAGVFRAASMVGGTVALATISHTFKVNWTDNNGGNPDSMLVSATQAVTQRFIAPISFPQSVTFTWTAPPLGQTLSVTVTAIVWRRGKTGTGSVNWAYTTPDAAPPNPTVDTFALQIAAVVTLPATEQPYGMIDGGVAHPVSLFCGAVKFADGAVALRAKNRGVFCDSVYAAAVPAAVVSAAQQARADSVCLTWRWEQPGHAYRLTTFAGRPLYSATGDVWTLADGVSTLTEVCPAGTPGGLQFGVRLALR